MQVQTSGHRFDDDRITYRFFEEVIDAVRQVPGVTAAAAFGTTLHVCGPDRAALLKAIEPYRADPSIKWQEAEPTLEDIFIHLMGKAQDNAPGA